MNQHLTTPPWAVKLNPNREWLFVAGVIFLGFVILLCWAAVHNALGVSRNDDWVYLHMEKWFLETGIFVVDSESMTNASGLIFTAAPIAWLFGYSITLLQLFVAVIGLIGIFALWLLLRTFLPIFWTSISVLTLIFTPYWGSLTLSFMTDVPAFTFQTLGLLFFLYAVRGVKVSYFWAILALSFSLLAFSCREYAIVGLIAVSLALLFSSFRNQISRWPLAINFVFVTIFNVSAYAIYHWRTTLSNAKVSAFSLSEADLIAAVYLIAAALVTTSIFMWPALSSASIFKSFTTKSWWRNSLSILVFIAVLLAGYRLSTKRAITIGNYFGVKGSYAETLPLGTYPGLLPESIFILLQWLGIVSLAFIAALIILTVTDRKIVGNFSVKKLPETFVNAPQAIVLIFVFGTVAVLALVAGITTAPLFDRYLLPLFPFASALILVAVDRLGIRAKYSKVQSVAVLALMGLLGFVYVDTTMTLDGAQWKIASELESQGFAPETIDGGYMWFGYHQNEVATGENLKWSKNWWTTLYEHPSICAMVGIGEVDPSETQDKELISHLTAINVLGNKYQLWAIATPETCH